MLYNFSSYEGLNEFDFTSTDKTKNIILIGGKNGAGKTSLFTAIKIALYGPLTYGYIGANSHYISKIKECINAKAFQMDKVESRVQITLSLMVEREVKEYEIIREWDYSNQKLAENFYVNVEGQMLNEQEVSYFMNYLHGLVPPDLFEFFLFDGEEVGNIFSTTSYNTYVKNAIYTLCGLDVFEIIRKQTVGYVGKAANEDETVLYEAYEELRKEVEDLQLTKDAIDEEIVIDQGTLEQIEIELSELETAFKKAGGITEKERGQLSREYESAEKVKMEAGSKVKTFVEGLMPFFILSDFTGRITEQLDFEEKGEIYYYVQQKLKQKDVEAVLGDSVPDSTVNALMTMLLEKFKPKGFSEKSEPIHDLSKENIGRVNAIISSVEDFDVDEMVMAIKHKQAASERTIEINKVLRSAMGNEESAHYKDKENALLKKRDDINRGLYEKHIQQEKLAIQIIELGSQRDRAWQSVREHAQNMHVYELSNGLSTMMNTLLSSKVILIRKRLEKLIVEKLQHIYRKNNLITRIEIDADFQFKLYQNAIFTASELLYLMQNLGKDGFLQVIGEHGKKILCDKYSVADMNGIQKALFDNHDEKISLYKNIELGRLSKGERQIFILSLYWAIIELSGKDIPFVIDTPYARIDANHRKEISEKFFPNISEQVIILSTDEEINEEYYEIIKPYVAREYLLRNDENHNRTSIDNRYFFGEKL